ncbi:hypothetical protein DPR02_33770 [Burkholderia cepacia]|uniref:Uncharacterized protein n=1 Tax=Burkholderia cepacia TaxID=292 RepID=A0AAQ0F625_BURCE|nr:hypothetical protein DPR02_33770 [Burkholderia cepacia]
MSGRSPVLRFFGSSVLLSALLPYCPTALLPYCLTALPPCRLAALPPCRLTPLLPDDPTIRRPSVPARGGT